MKFVVFLTFSCLGLVAAAAIHRFGILYGTGIVAAVWLLMPQIKAHE